MLVLSYLLELVLVLPGLSEAGNGFSVLISSAFNIDDPPGLARGIRPGAGGRPGAGQGRARGGALVLRRVSVLRPRVSGNKLSKCP